MIHPGDYVQYVRNAKQHRSVLARVALNVLYDPDAFPVDLSEVLSLGSEERHMARGLISWCTVSPTHFSSRSAERVEDMKLIAAHKSVGEAEQ